MIKRLRSGQYYNTSTHRFASKKSYDISRSLRRYHRDKVLTEKYFRTTIEKIFEKPYDQASKRWGRRALNKWRHIILDTRIMFEYNKRRKKWIDLRTGRVIARDTMKRTFRTVRMERMIEQYRYDQWLKGRSVSVKKARAYIKKKISKIGWRKTIKQLLHIDSP